MPLNVPEGFGVLSYRFALTADAEVMVCTVGVDVAFGASDPQDKVDQKADAFASGFIVAGIVAGWSFLGCQLAIPDGGGSSVIFEAPRIHIGTAAAQALPNNCAYLIRKTSAVAGRRGRGRMFLPPFVGMESNVNANGTIDPTVRTNLQNSIDTALPGDDFVILHNTVPSIMAPTPITGFILDNQIATQRRRMR